VFGSVRVDATGVRAAADFLYAAIGGEIIHPIAPGLAVFANGRLDTKNNSGELPSRFDQNNIIVNGGLTYLLDKNLWRFMASHATVEVDNKRFRDVDSLSGELSHQIDELQSAGPFVQLARLNYMGDNEPRNADFYAAGANYRKAFIGPFQPLLTVSASVADEHNTQNRPDLGRTMWGGRVAVAVTPAPKWSAAVGVAYQNSKYSAQDPLLLTTRKDDYYALDATVGYAFSRHLSLRGELLLSDNKSNLELYEYKRNIIGAKLRYDF
jgi:hypothetical protein